MKKILQQLFIANHRYYEVWSYLYIMSEDGCTDFQHNQLCKLFGIPKSTLSRILSHQDTWNTPETITRIEKTSIGYRVVFVQEEKKVLPTKMILTENLPVVHPLYDKRIELHLPWLKEFYRQKGVSYPNIEDDKKFIWFIWEKIEKAMEQTGQGTNVQRIDDNLRFFFTKIPEWWIQNSCTLPTINNKFSTIYQQIKNASNDTTTSKKSTSYAREANGLDEENYTFLVSPAKGSGFPDA